MQSATQENVSDAEACLGSMSQRFAALMRANRFADAAGVCGEAIEANPGASEPYMWLAELYQLTGDAERAANCLGDAIIRDPSNGEAFERLSDTLWQLGRREFAVRALETALALGRDRGESRRNLADRLYQSGAKERARDGYRRVLELEPGCQRSRAMLSLFGGASAPPVQTAFHASAPEVLDTYPAWRNVHLCVVAPPGNPHVGAFADLVTALDGAFRRLGCTTTRADNEVRHGPVNIVFGGHLMGSGQAVGQFPDTTVFFNLEQVEGFSLDRHPFYKDLLKNFPVWDYSARNAAALRNIGCTANVLKLGYDGTMERISRTGACDCDVLFYGSLNDRRANILRQLQSAGVAVRHLFNAYGSTRDEAIASARIVLNLHYYEDAIHEIVRTSYLLANHTAIVSECNPETEIDDDIREAVRAVPYAAIVSACIELLRNNAARENLAKNGYAIFRMRDQAEHLQQAIETTSFLSRA